MRHPRYASVPGWPCDGIEFSPCNLDPEAATTADLPQGMSVDDLPQALPYPLGSIDIITCTEMVEHLFSLKTLMLECARVLAPGGILYITTNNVMHRVGLLRIFMSQDTNLDSEIDQTTIWPPDSQFPGAGTCGSIRRSCWARWEPGGRLGREAMLDSSRRTKIPDVIIWPHRGLLAPFRRRSCAAGRCPTC